MWAFVYYQHNPLWLTFMHTAKNTVPCHAVPCRHTFTKHLSQHSTTQRCIYLHWHNKPSHGIHVSKLACSCTMVRVCNSYTNPTLDQKVTIQVDCLSVPFTFQFVIGATILCVILCRSVNSNASQHTCNRPSPPLCVWSQTVCLSCCALSMESLTMTYPTIRCKVLFTMAIFMCHWPHSPHPRCLLQLLCHQSISNFTFFLMLFATFWHFPRSLYQCQKLEFLCVIYKFLGCVCGPNRCLESAGCEHQPCTLSWLFPCVFGGSFRSPVKSDEKRWRDVCVQESSGRYWHCQYLSGEQCLC